MKNTELVEQELIKSILKGDTQLYADIVVRYQDLVANLCYKLAGNKIDIEEVTQRVFVELYESLPRFRFEAKLSTFIYRITVNIIRKTVGKNKRYIKLNTENYENSRNERLIDEQIMHDEQINELYRAMDKLKYEQKLALTLYCFDECSYKEIAEIMEVSLSKVESLIFRAKVNLKRMLVEL